MLDHTPLGRTRRMTRWVMLCLLLVSAAVNVLMLASPIYMMQIYDRVIATRHYDTLVYLSVMTFVALLALAGFDLVRNLVGHRLGAWIERRLAGETLAATVRLAHLAGAGRTVQGLRDLATVRGLFANGGLWPLLDAPWMPIFFVAIYLIHPMLFWCSLAGGLVLLLLALANEAATRGPMRDAAAAGIRATAEADAAVRNADSMTAMGILPSFVRAWARIYEEGAGPQLVAGQRSAAIASFARFVRLVLQMAILGAGAYLVIRGEITGGVMIAAAILTSRAVAPLEQGIASWRGLVAGQLAYRRLQRLILEAPRVTEGIRLPRPEGALAVERVGYTLAALREPILRGVSFAVAPGESVAVIGPSGAGKTTLLRVIVGSLVPQVGVARLDGAAAHQLALVDKNLYVGYLPQDIELFNGTVRQNIARFSDASDEDVVAAARAAGAHDTILKLPDGYQTELGPHGVTLSGGQRQRIGLARALFGDPRLVVLDEPNANLDADGEQALIAALRRLRERRVTVVLVTQRMSLLTEVDKVLMLRAGAAEAFKPAAEIMEELSRAAAAAKGAAPAPAPGTLPTAEPRRPSLWVMQGPRAVPDPAAQPAKRSEP